MLERVSRPSWQWLALGLWLAFLAAQAVQFAWPVVDAQFKPVPQDFLAVWTAGKVALSGHAATVYDTLALHRVQVAAAGHPFVGYYPFIYPPLIFLTIAMGLALLPFAAAFAVWALATLTGYLAVVRKLFRDRYGLLAFGAAPACFYCFSIAQNGLFTAGLFGGFLLTLRTRPLASGLLLAALAYKPQYGVLIPLALLAGGYWRPLAVAAAAVGIWLAAWLLIDPAVLPASLHLMEHANNVYLAMGTAGWNKMQSIYAVLRLLGLGAQATMAVQLGVTLALAVAAIAIWRSRASFALKAAFLAAAAVLVTPYAFIYDLPLLSVATGFVYFDRPFDRYESALVWIAYGFVALYPILVVPSGLVGQMFLWVLLVRRLGQQRHLMAGAVV